MPKSGGNDGATTGCEDSVVSDYSKNDLMAAILALQDATAAGFTALEARLTRKIEDVEASLCAKIQSVDVSVHSLRHDMNRRFDRVDIRFDGLERRVGALEQHGERPTL
jgi:hypothetical protein